MKNTVLYILIILFTAVTYSSYAQIIPTPSHVKRGESHIILGKKITVNSGNVDSNVLHYLEKELKKEGVEVTYRMDDAQLSFLRLSTFPREGYNLIVNESINIQYTDDAGAFYGVNSLLQLIRERKHIHYIDDVFIRDAPRFEWRGLHLDVSRHFFTVDEIKSFIDHMALYKFNRFHWHLTDDQGWRIEIKKYPRLTGIGGFRDSTVIGHYSDSPRRYDTTQYGGFYTQEQVKEVVAYAASKYITVVPEIEMPGHSRAALAAYPELSCTGERLPVPGLWGIFDDIYCSKSESIDFMKDVLAEVVDLFPSEYIHVGGDEAPKTRWKECMNCQGVIQSNGLKDEHELQSYFIQQIDDYLSSKGRKLIGWDEILEGGLSSNAAVMSWRGEKGGVEAAKQGHYVVMSPTTYCYFDYYQSSNPFEPLAIGGYLPLEKVYEFDPIPDELSREQHLFILGGQANLWTEYMPSMDHVEYMAFPRALALIQGLWCTNKPDYDSFLQTYVDFHEDYLIRHKVNVSKSIHYPVLQVERHSSGIGISFNGVDEKESFQLTEMDSSYSFTGKVRSGEVINIDIDRNHKIKTRPLVYELTSDKFDDTLRYQFDLHNAVGIDVVCETLPHPKYDHNGGLNLVDGIQGGQRWKGSEWLGFTEKEVVLVLNLDGIKKVNGLEVGLLERNGSWIYLPKSIALYASEDSENWSSLAQSFDIENGVNKVEFDQCSPKYIKIVLDAMDVIPESLNGAGNIPWTFIDEIKIVQ